MDLSSLTDFAMGALVAAQSGAAAAVTDAATNLGKAGVEKITSLVKARFAQDGEGATNALATLENNPADAGAQKTVRRRLEGLLDEDPAFAADIKAVIGPINIDNSKNQNGTASGHGVVNQIIGNNNSIS